MLKRRRREESNADLNLIPVMNLFVCLLPFLLLTAAFVKMGGIRAEMPAAHAGEQKDQPRDEAQIIDLVFQVDGTQVEVVGFSKSFQIPLDDVQAKFTTTQLDGLDEYLNKVHQKYPRWGSTLFKASSATKFEDAVAVLGKLRGNDRIKNLVLAAEVVE